MPISVAQLTPLPTPPQKTDPANFAERADNFLAALPDFTTKFNNNVVNLNNIGSGLDQQEPIAAYSAVTTYNFPTVVAGSDGYSYRCVGTSVSGDNPVGSVTGNWVYLSSRVSDTAYGTSWNGVTSIAPSKNAVYDYLEGFIEKRNTQVSGVNAEGHIFGLGITTSGQVITVSPGACLDSTETVQMALTADATWTVPGTNNLETYLFLVRLVADGTLTVKGYSTYAGPSSDTLVDKWRFISWAKNNGSGVLMPYVQVGGTITWTVGSNRPQLTASNTTSYVSYNIAAQVPNALCSEIGLMAGSNGGSLQLYFSFDGTTDFNSIALGWVLINPVASVYIKHTSVSTPVWFSSITLRR